MKELNELTESVDNTEEISAAAAEPAPKKTRRSTKKAAPTSDESAAPKRTTRRRTAAPKEKKEGSVLFPTPAQETYAGERDTSHPLRILMAGAEALPFAASGGLGDVLGSLPAALKARMGDGVDIRVVMPLYGQVKQEWRDKMSFVGAITVRLSWRQQYCGIFTLEKDGVTWYFIDNEYYFQRENLYGCFDDGERFLLHRRAGSHEQGGFLPRYSSRPRLAERPLGDLPQAPLSF